MDFYEFNRQFNGGMDDGYEYKMKSVPQMYPPMAPMANMMPTVVPVPMMTIRPGAELEYNRWLNGNYQQQQYRNNFYEQHNSYPRSHGHDLEPINTQDRRVFPDDLGDLSPPFSGPNSPRFGPGPPIVTSDKVKGPRGCNLFVFHLPNEITNWDLYLLFRKYGTILSVHTMINKTTGLSKGYGFVSYSAREEAKAAISAMDGFRLGKKRLKVQVKRSQDDLLENDGEEGQELDPEALYEAGAFESGETSGVTTRASTPHGTGHHHQPANVRSASHSSSESLHSHHSPSQADEAKAGGEEATSAPDVGEGKVAASIAHQNLTPITPMEAEAQVRREALQPGTTTRTPTTSTLSSTPRSGGGSGGGRDGHGVHHGAHTAHPHISVHSGAHSGVHGGYGSVSHGSQASQGGGHGGHGSDAKLAPSPAHGASDAARKHG